MLMPGKVNHYCKLAGNVCNSLYIPRGTLIDWLFHIVFKPLRSRCPWVLLTGPFVPHNLISARESPVPLPKFQMAPRLKILMSTWSEKRTQIYYPFLSKVPASESPPGSPVETLWREMPVSRAFLNISSRVPSKGFLPEALRTEPLQRETLHS